MYRFEILCCGGRFFYMFVLFFYVFICSTYNTFFEKMKILDFMVIFIRSKTEKMFFEILLVKITKYQKSERAIL